LTHEAGLQSLSYGNGCIDQRFILTFRKKLLGNPHET
jgi:hypothetical protein